MTRAAQPLVVLMPPSEGKAPGGRGLPWQLGSGRFGPVLAEARAAVVAALRSAEGGDSACLGVSGQHLERAQLANRSLLASPTSPASERYTGVVFGHLSMATLPPGARRRAHESLVIVSALLGAVGIDDPVPDYRLKMGAGLPGLGRLASWWRPILSDALGEAFRDHLVVDVLPLEHRSALVLPACVERIQIRFVERSGAVAGHAAKAAKGLFVRHLLTSRGSVKSAIKRFEHQQFEVVSG